MVASRWRVQGAIVLACLASCGGGASGGDSDGGTGGQGGGSGGGGGGGAPGDGAAGDGGVVEPPASVCTAPEGAADVSKPTSVVGKGDAASCAEADFAAAVAKGGVVTFSCGDAPATIKITKAIA